VTVPSSSPIEDALAGLAAINPSWVVDVGPPHGPGWIAGSDFRDAGRGPFNELLVRIAQRFDTEDRRTVAASFALRFGWISAMAIAPYLRFSCVPDVTLDNVSFKFTASTFFERAAVHVPRGTMVAGDPRGPHAAMAEVADESSLLRVLRDELVAQSAPVVDALFAWSGFAPKGSWGMLTSAWAAHFTGLAEDQADHRGRQATIEALFDGGDVVDAMRPRLHPVTLATTTHLFQRRASCCRYYLLPQGSLCASCPLVSQEERVQRNLAWMRSQADRPSRSGGHD
jgi:hypothetical protein